MPRCRDAEIRDKGKAISLSTRHNLIIWLSTICNQKSKAAPPPGRFYGYKDRHFSVINC